MNNMTPDQKKRRFRELAQHDWIRTGRQLAEELEQPFLLLPVPGILAGPPARGRAARLFGNRDFWTGVEPRRRIQ
jgi:hypothetical protein